MRYTYDSSIVSDLHKEAIGFRPAPDFWAEWNQATADERQYIWDNLLTAAEHAQDVQEQEEQEEQEANRELRELAAEAVAEAEHQAYMEYLDAMLHAFYEENFITTEWDLV